MSSVTKDEISEGDVGMHLVAPLDVEQLSFFELDTASAERDDLVGFASEVRFMAAWQSARPLTNYVKQY